MARRVSWPFGDRLPILTLPEMMMYSRSPAHPGRTRVPAAEVGGLQLAGQRGRRVGFDSLEDSSPAEDFVHGWPHQLLSRMTRLFSRVSTEQTYSNLTTAWARRVLDRGRRTAGATFVDRARSRRHFSPGCPTGV